jgi:hypothetical protein
MILDLLFIVSINILWLIGGQCSKAMRRYCLPAICAFKGILEARKGHRRWDIPVMVSLLLVGILSMGYGVDSWLKKACGGVEWVTRLVMSLLIVAAITPLMIGHWSWIKLTITLIMSIAAWQVRAGSLAKIGKYDILLEDICRASSLALAIVLIS